MLLARHGKKSQVVAIGPSGEKKSLLAAIMNDKERAAGRSGLGAVMGAKRLKAVVVKGAMAIPMYDTKRLNRIRRELLKQKQGFFDTLHIYGTAGITHDSALSGDSPIKNWGGSGLVDFPSENARRISDDAVIGVKGYKSYACSRCVIGCGGRMDQADGPFALEYNKGRGHKPEYETLCMLGSNLLNDDLASIIKLNEMCNVGGIDTIALGGTLGWVIECYESGLLSKKDLDGLEMTWGNAPAIVEMSRKIIEREGVGDLLADGVKVAVERFGDIGGEFAIHIQGEEVPAHDPRFTPGLVSTYSLAATPARHTQGGELLGPPSGLEMDPIDKYTYSGHAENHWKLVTSSEVVNAAGLCMFSYLSFPFSHLPDQLSAVTGWEFDDDAIFETGERIFTMRHLFNLREGQNALARHIPGRLIGESPLTEGNVKGVTIDWKTLNREFLEKLHWDPHTTIPAADHLHELGMDFAVADQDTWHVPMVEDLVLESA